MQLEFPTNTLDQGSTLHWYQIGMVLGSGGFGITYLAHDQNLNRRVAIKEYMPEEYAFRSKDKTIQPKTIDKREAYEKGRQRFIVEAQTLAKFNHPNIVRVVSVFEENNTAYMVMEYTQGRELSKLYESEGTICQIQLLDIFIPLIDGLSLVHNENFIHRDIKPSNIYINNNDKPVLLDFGSARQAIVDKSRTLTSIFTAGYAPYEQYHDRYAEQGPWTDIYALGACMYVGITGKKPVDAINRAAGLLKGEPDPYIPVSLTHNQRYTNSFLLAVDHALMFEPEQRPQDTTSWAKMLIGELQAPLLPKHMLQAYSAMDQKTVVMPKKIAADNTEPYTNTGPSTSTRSSSRTGTTSRSTPSSQPGTASRPSPSSRSGTTSRPAPSSRSGTASRPAPSPRPGTASRPAPSPRPGTASRPAPSSRSSTSPRNSALQDSLRLIDSYGKRSTAPVMEFSSYKGDIERLKNKRASGFTVIISSILLIVALAVVAKYQLDLNISELVSAFSWDDNPVKPEEKIAIQELEKSKIQDLKQSKPSETEITLDDKSVNKSLAVQDLLTKADIAFIRKYYTSPSNSSAAYYFNEVLKIDPNNSTARNGLQKIETQLVENTRDAMKGNHLTKAKDFLAQLDQLNTNSDLSKTLRVEISQLEAGKNEINNMISQARALQEEKYLTRPKGHNAYAVYQQILAKSPGNESALSGIQEIQDHYVQQFNKHLYKLKLSKAENDLNILAEIQLPQALLKELKTNLASEKSFEEKIRADRAQVAKAQSEKARAEKAQAKKARAEKTLADKERGATKIEPVKPVTVTLNQVSQMLSAFKTCMENQQFEELNQLSQFSPGRDQFIKQLFSQYRNMKINISNVQFIPLQNKANAEIKLSNLVSVDGAKTDNDAASQFQISLHLDQEQNLKIFW